MDALKGMFPVEPGALEEAIEMNWSSWDADRNGTLGEKMGRFFIASSVYALVAPRPVPSQARPGLAGWSRSCPDGFTLYPLPSSPTSAGGDLFSRRIKSIEEKSRNLRFTVVFVI